MAKYRIFAPEDNPLKFKGQEDKIFEEFVFDLERAEQFKAKIMVSQLPQEGYESALIQIRGDFLPGDWFIKIVEREEEAEAEVTIYQPAKLSERRGYMLRSMLKEEKEERKREIMGSELQEREKAKREMLKRMRKA